MAYTVRELFYTLQGEGANAGAPAVFCRFAGCNLWTGLEDDRPTAICKFCDTDFVGGDKYDAPALALAIRHLFPFRTGAFVVLTGGEPTLQVDARLIHELHALGCYIAMETNGTRPVPAGIDWITVSPKANTDVVQQHGQELKVVVPQEGLDLHMMRRWKFQHYFVQPMHGHIAGVATAVCWAMTYPGWRVSSQMHRTLGIP